MAADVETRKRKRLAKNKKRSWRKTDIDDVEEHLEDIRLQERTGGIAAEKEDHELFFVDTSTVTPDHDEPPVKRKREAKPLKCHALLEPDPNTKPGRVKQYSITKRCTAIQEKSKMGLKSETEKKAAEQRSQATSQRETRSKESKKLYTAEYDLWSASVGVPDPSVDEFYLKQTKQTRKRPPSWYHEKTSEYKAIEVPHPGTSYNPTFEDHQELLAKAVDVETEKEKQAMKIKRALDDVFAKGGSVPMEQRWMEEMSVGLKDEEGDDSHVNQNRDEEEATDDLGLSCNPPVRREDKKTEKQRRKERERKELEEKLSKSKGEKQRKNDIFRLKNIKKAVKEREVAVAESKRKKATRRDESKGKTKKLGKMKYEEPELDLKLSDELQGSLRLLKPEGHLLNDRYKSLQKRNIIEPRQKVKALKKYKRKKFEKKSHKEITI